MDNNKLSQNSDNYNDDFDFTADFHTQKYKFIVPIELAGMRLDAILAKLMPDYSRSRLTSWLKEGFVWVNNQHCAAKTKLIGHEEIVVEAQESQENLAFTPEPIDLDVVYEDHSVIVLNKQAGQVVHPAAGNWQGTVLNGLLYHYPDLKQVPRAGIVHRLDKDTSGLMVVARTLKAQNHLVKQLQERSVKRIYRAIANGIVPFDGKIDANIGRDPHNRLKMAVVKFGGKEAITHVKVLERYEQYSYIECVLETGRTHQIRVHMREAKHPLVGDPIYGNLRHPASDSVKEAIKMLGRQALHAFKLSFIHPESGELVHFKAALPEDMHYLLSVLRLESGKESQLTSSMENQLLEDDEDWDDDDYDVEVRYVPD
ncbi:23S rRNA pseudouridine(1911/1915/1917) synthase RluD [Neisseria sp. Ec49-e6-T10]|uniref:23S rRNA pseudouridine(1911/1915/1917) synthase RluD n=1 Tax=Neisseria sp. Ec49-e6-T10 TaxID=3140744 RepID=UPI003EB88EE6